MSGIPPELERRIEEALLLPEGDAKRDAVRREAESLGEPGARRWSALEREQDALRAALRDAPTPPGMRERLLEIPRAETPRRPMRIRAAILAAAACLLLVAGGALLLDRRAEAQAGERLATLAMHDHLSRPELVVHENEPAALFAALTPLAPYPVSAPEQMRAARPVGGRICTFGETPIVYTRWREGDEEVSMYQVRRGDFGFGAGDLARRIRLNAGGGHEPCTVNLRADGEFVYAIVRSEPPAQDPTN